MSSRVVKLDSLSDEQLRTRVRMLAFDLDHAKTDDERRAARDGIKAAETMQAKRKAARGPAGGVRGRLVRLIGGEAGATGAGGSTGARRAPR